jgi:hypothetical protein
MTATGWKRLGVIVAVPAALVACYVLIATWLTYSQGERAGILQSVKRTGRFCKTYEGELAMATVPGVMPEIWRFSVRDAHVLPELDRALGKHVTLRYDEQRYLPTDCFGETRFFVTGVIVREADQAVR